MTLEQKIGQMITVAVPGKSINEEIKGIISKYRPGGIILFGFNIGTASDTKKLIQDLQECSLSAGSMPLFISIDQEGGRVRRIVDGVTQFPGNMAAGIAGDPDLTYRWGKIMGMQLRLMGVNMNLTPDLDVNNNPDNPVINTRSFGSDPLLVAELGISFIKGLQEMFCIAVGKHFPGHGDTNKDSHRTLPSIQYDLDRLRMLELVPFIRAIAAGVEGIMSAHIAFPAILHNDDPATISHFFLHDLLRTELGFRGLVLTDDMEMDAIRGRMDIGEGAVKAVTAGADIVLISTYGISIPKICTALATAVKDGRITAERIDESVKRIVELKLRYRIMSYTEGKIGPGNPVFDKSDYAMLESADALNSEISRKGILYCGDPLIMKGKGGTVKIVVTANKILTETLNSSRVKVMSQFVPDQIMNIMKGSNKQVVLYYHVENENLGTLRPVCAASKQMGLPVVIVTSGNPFPVARNGVDCGFLFSFSSTDESIRQLGHCIKGDFMPRMNASLNLGIPCQMKTGTDTAVSGTQ